MTGAELIAEGERLAKPCVLLKATGPDDALAAIWGGPGVVPAPYGFYRHWLSIDCRFLPAGLGPSAGCLSVYTDEEHTETGAAVHDPSKSLSSFPKHRPLYAHRARSLPPLEGVFRFGAEAVQQWLHTQGWRPDDGGYYSHFQEPEPALAYQQRYESECPLFVGGAFAVLGGWHLPWPEGDWARLLEQTLLVWTFEESEPWVEVWGGQDGYCVKARVT
jgi:hypothetical protein